MRLLFSRVLTIALAFFALSGPVYAQAPKLEWKTYKQWPGWICLFVDGQYAGGLEPFSGLWQYAKANEAQDIRKFTFDHNPPTRKHGEEPGTGALPAKPKAAVKEEDDIKKRAGVREEDGDKPQAVTPRDAPPRYLTGVMDKELQADGRDHYSVGGKITPREEALKAIEAAGGIPDDNTKPRLIVVATDATRKKIVDDFQKDPVFTYWRDKVVFLQYPPGHDHVSADRKFVQPVGDQPMIQLQRADGGVHWRQTHYVGAQELARALRDADPTYDSKKDPHPPDDKTPLLPAAEPESPLSLILAWLGGLGCPLLAAGGAVTAGGAYVVAKKRKGPT